MTSSTPGPTLGLLLSGGLDSSILLAHLLRRGERVQPFYVRSGHIWQQAEQAAVCEYLAALSSSELRSSSDLRPLVTIDLPLANVMGDHWSMTGRQVPGAGTPDEAVYLPGRNLLLIVNAALWCQLHRVAALALGTLQSNPFADATPAFFHDLEALLNRGAASQVKIVRPFEELTKREVMELGRNCPLELTFSCLAPSGRRHCGRCNKCGERQSAFRALGWDDPTIYAHPATGRCDLLAF